MTLSRLSFFLIILINYGIVVMALSRFSSFLMEPLLFNYLKFQSYMGHTV